jgi:hypothetical protein
MVVLFMGGTTCCDAFIYMIIILRFHPGGRMMQNSSR